MTSASSTVPPKVARSRLLVFFAGSVAAVAVLSSGAVLFFFNPSTHGFYPVCLFHELTGLNCPGCGGTRSAYQLLHGHLMAALRDNALFVLTLAGLGLRGAWFAICRLRSRPASLAVAPKALWAYAIVAIAFTVLRNLPAFQFLSP